MVAGNAFIGLTNSNQISSTVNYNDMLIAIGNTKQNIVLGLSNSTGLVTVQGTGNVGFMNPRPLFTIDVNGCIHTSSNILTPMVSMNGANIFGLNTHIGINQSNPAYTLDITGDINLTGNIYQSGVMYTIGSSNNSATTGGGGTTTTTGGGGTTTTGGSGTTIQYIQSQWKNNGNEVFIMNSNVGIGISTPVAPLHVLGNVHIDNGDLFVNNVVKYAGVEFLPGLVQNNYVCSNNFYNDIYQNAGNIGINQNYPIYTLDILGDINFTGNIFQNGIQYNVPATSLYVSSSNGVSNTIIEIQSAWNTSVCNVYILHSNIGIGTASPAAPLHIVGDMRVDGAIYNNNSAQYTGIEFLPSLQQHNYTNKSFLYDNVFEFNENIGICQQTPGFTLDVSGDINFTGILYNNGTQYNPPNNSYSSNNLSQWTSTSNTPVVYICNSNVGIGTKKPLAPLHVVGDVMVDGGIYVNNSAQYTGVEFLPGLVQTNLFNVQQIITNSVPNITLDSHNGIVFSSNQMYFSSVGFLGIGTCKPTCTLDVIGDVNVAGCTTMGSTVAFSNPDGKVNIYSAGTCMGINQAMPTYALQVGGSIFSSGDVTALSDRRVKCDLKPLKNSLSKIRKINGYSFCRIDDVIPRKHIGMVAQEVSEIFPELVEYDAFHDQYSIKYGNAVAILLEAIKDLDKQVSSMRKQYRRRRLRKNLIKIINE